MKSSSIPSLIRRRYSCRNYASQPLSPADQSAVAACLAALPPGPFQKPSRFKLIAAAAGDSSALRGLGTYGFIKNPAAFLIAATAAGPLSLEDFGYRMEHIVLSLTGLNLGTCWLGGTFSRSAFAQKIGAGRDELVPAVCAVGYPLQDGRPENDAVMQMAGSRERLGWESLFYEDEFHLPLSAQHSGAYAEALEMVRLAPSASNKQPWRILRRAGRWHFYLQRTIGYREMSLARLTGIADMQRVDLGIAMCHFELSARELGLPGRWELSDPALSMPDLPREYVATWLPG